MLVDKSTQKLFLDILKKNQIYLEGNILKVLESDDTDFNNYLVVCKEKDRESRKKRLDITKQVQSQNRELEMANVENINLMNELKISLEESNKLKEDALKAKNEALNDLDVLQKRTQTELIGVIVRVALYVIIGVGVSITFMYGIILISGIENRIIESTWSNLLGILLTNSFSIIGTIMGIKYASDKR